MQNSLQKMYIQTVSLQTNTCQSYILDLHFTFSFPVRFSLCSFRADHICLPISVSFCLSISVSLCLSVSLSFCLFLSFFVSLSPPSVCLASCLDMSSMYTGTYYIHVCSEHWSLSVSVPLFVCPCVSVSACVCLSLSLCLSVCVCLSLSLSVLPFHNNDDCHFVN